jgi:hypothetical protein
MKRERITVTVDAEWIAAGAAAVAEGRADSVSAWVSQAMAEKAANDRRLRFLDLAIADYEAEFGVITDEEMDEQERLDRQSAAEFRAECAARRAGTAA